MRQLVLIAHNLRSSHNVGSILRTADGVGIEGVYLTGYSPYPLTDKDSRLPHIARKVDAAISKTALGAEKYIKWQHTSDVAEAINKLKADGYKVIALEQTQNSKPIKEFIPPDKVAILVGREVDGIEPEVINLCDEAIEIPMLGKKESFNVVQAAAMALYHCRYTV